MQTLTLCLHEKNLKLKLASESCGTDIEQNVETVQNCLFGVEIVIRIMKQLFCLFRKTLASVTCNEMN